MNLQDTSPQTGSKDDGNESSPEQSLVVSKKCFWQRAMWFSVAGIIIPPVFGLLGTVYGMVGAFSELSKTGGSDPEALASSISKALETTAWGLVVSFLFLILFIVALNRFLRFRKLVLAKRD